jgi:hypothetical protein
MQTASVTIIHEALLPLGTVEAERAVTKPVNAASHAVGIRDTASAMRITYPTGHPPVTSVLKLQQDAVVAAGCDEDRCRPGSHCGRSLAAPIWAVRISLMLAPEYWLAVAREGWAVQLLVQFSGRSL